MHSPDQSSEPDAVPSAHVPATDPKPLWHAHLRSSASIDIPQPKGFSLRNLLTPALFFGLLMAWAFFSRLFLLAAKPLHHDESLFSYYSYFLYKGWGYEYQPILHGPILENVTALVFLLFGHNNFTMRLPAAIGGLLMFLVYYFWRGYLRRAGFMAALLLLAVSPSITYYTRFLRNDVPYLMVTCWCALVTILAMRTGHRKYVLWAILTATIMFCMMESSIFFFNASIWFLIVIVVADWLAGARSRESIAPDFPGEALIVVPRKREDADRGLTGGILAWSALAALVLDVLMMYFFFRIFSDSIPLHKKFAALATNNGVPISAKEVQWFGLPLLAYSFFYVISVIAGMNWRKPYGRHGVLHYVLHLLWNNRWTIFIGLSIAVAFFTTLFTTWFTHVRGKDFFAKGGEQVWLTPVQIYKNTWDYWWDQHKLHRIKGPFHYYLPILFLYELPAILIILRGWWRALAGADSRTRSATPHLFAFISTQLIAGIIYLTATTTTREFLKQVIDWKVLDDKLHISQPAHLFIILFYAQIMLHLVPLLFFRGRKVEAFVTFWMIGNLFAYSYAGEKVPWLAVHAAGPMLLLAGIYVQRIFTETRWTPFKRVVGVTLAVLALMYQLRSQVFANFIHPHSPAERIVYNHTTPDIELAVRRIHEFGQATNMGKTLPLHVRGEMEWPLYWYLREWPNATPPLDETVDTTSRPIVLVNWEQSNAANLRDNYEIRRLKIREWWEPPFLDLKAMAGAYRIFTPKESRRQGTENHEKLHISLLEWRKLWHYMAYREIFLDMNDPVFSNSANEFAFCVRKDISEQYLSRFWLNAIPMRRDIPVFP